MYVIAIPEQGNNFLTTSVYLDKIFMPSECDIISNLSIEKTIPILKKDEEQSFIKYNDGYPNSRLIPFDKDNAFIFKRLINIVSKVNNDYFKFSLTTIRDLQVIELSNYSSIDYFIGVGSGNNANRKISFVIFLSDNNTYEGGALKWSPNTYTFPPDYNSLNFYGVPPQGTAVFFTSFLASSILPVTSGSSKILIGWAEGPSFS